MALHEGQNLGPYRVLSQLGQGGMATVYKGYHARLDRYVAIKVVHQALLEDPTFLTRFEREAQIVAKLDHPHIVPVYDYAEHEGQPYLVMKHIEGETLKSLLSRGPLPLERIVAIVSDVAGALDYAHGQGILHRDVKPSNIILDEKGTIYLTDFGLARIAQAGESTLSQDVLIGTPHYISPEQAMGKKEIDARSDVYSLGVVLYELLVGRVPFSADTPYAIIHDHIYRPLPLPSKVNPEIPEQVERVLLKALAKDSADRYESATAMVEAFRRAMAESGLTQLDPNRVGNSTVMLARMREESDGTPPSSVPSPLPEDKQKRSWVVRPSRESELKIDLGYVGSQLKEMASGWEDKPWHPDNWHGEPVPKSEEDSIRRRLETSYKKRTEFLTHLGVYAFINVMLWLIFAFAGSTIADVANLEGVAAEAVSFPWPLIVMFGWGSGLLAHAVETYFETGERAARRDRRVRETMRAEYGDDWTTISKDKYNKLRKRVIEPYNKRKEFLQHVAVYLAINTMLWLIFAFSGPLMNALPDAADVMGFPWPIIVMLGWGAGLVGHFVDMVGHSGINPEKREQEIQREIARERDLMEQQSLMLEKPKRDAAVRLNEDGELTDSVAEAWEMDKPKRRAR